MHCILATQGKVATIFCIKSATNICTSLFLSKSNLKLIKIGRLLFMQKVVYKLDVWSDEQVNNSLIGNVLQSDQSLEPK